mmetsp:Transcript_61513/g.144092  ORF Transcript_61513/g.144092 Transcript_61513/m.144092 type:complete len:591 (-) Transcript_61513:360-2132(-)
MATADSCVRREEEFSEQKGSKDAFQQEVMKALDAQHGEVLDRFRVHEDLLRQLLARPPINLGRRWSEHSMQANSELSEPTSLEPMQIRVEQMSSNGSKPQEASWEERVSHVPSGTTSSDPASSRLFKSYTLTDEMHKQQALHVGSQSLKKRFATTSHYFSGSRYLFWKAFVQHPSFEIFFGMVVITNAIFIGVDVQQSLSGDTPEAFQVVQSIYAFLFTLELTARLMAHGLRLFVSDDGLWTMLDVVIVLSSLWDLAVDIVDAIQAQAAQAGGFSGVSSLKAFRVVRITRIVKAIRLMKIFRFVMALRTLVTSILHTLKSLFWAMILLSIIIYVFAILFVQAVSDYIDDPSSVPLSSEDQTASFKYFGSLPNTMLSLFMSICGGVSWEEVIAPLRTISWIWLVCFLFFISFTYLAVLNVVTGVFCQSAIESAQNDHTTVVQSILADKQAHLAKITELFGKLGAKDGIITYTMFEEKINSPAVREYFESLGLDVWDAWTFFKLLDADAGGAVEIEEFLMGCLRLRGQARAMEIAKLIQDQHWLIKNQGLLCEYVESELGHVSQLKQDMDQLARLVGISLANGTDLQRSRDV